MERGGEHDVSLAMDGLGRMPVRARMARDSDRMYSV